MRIIVAAAALLCPTLASAASFERFDLPGATVTCGAAIASDGLVAGIGTAGGGVVGNLDRATLKHAKSFEYRSGHFTFPKLDLPVGVAVFTGVNRSRSVVGELLERGSLTFLQFEHAKGLTVLPTIPQGPVLDLTAINDAGTILGEYEKPATFPNLPREPGFIRDAAGNVTVLDDGSADIVPAGMDAAARYVVGHSLGETVTSWVYHGGVFSPVAYPGADYTFPSGVDSAGHVSGTYITGPDSALVVHGFHFRHGTYTNWDVPGASATSINGMNEAGQITGCFTKGGRTHGFVFTP